MTAAPGNAAGLQRAGGHFADRQKCHQRQRRYREQVFQDVQGIRTLGRGDFRGGSHGAPAAVCAGCAFLYSSRRRLT